MNEDTATIDQKNSDRSVTRIRDELVGRSFSTVKELRHLAERCGFSFIPVAVVNADERQAHMVLNPKGLGEVHVHADRSQRWHPFHIHIVERRAPK
jgi:hypothetical protein